MRDNQKRLNVYIPEDLYSQIAQSGRTVTETVIQALESFIERNALGQSQTENTELKAVQKARIKELQNHNEILIKELEDFKNLHNNYMLQMQTIITQKAVEAPETKKPWWRFW